MWVPYRQLLVPTFGHAGSNITIDAVGESVAYIGQAYLTSGPGTSKVFSSAGASAHIYAATVTWASLGSVLRVGVQDVATTGLEDGTYDVYKDITQGTDTISTTAINTYAFTNGTKTIAHGDLIAIVVEMTAKAGTDSLRQYYDSSNNAISGGGLPYLTADTGTGPVRTQGAPVIALTSDDGTLLTLDPRTCAAVGGNTNFNSTSTPDEYALVFKSSVRCKIDALVAFLGELDSGDTGTLTLYASPTSNPVALTSVTIDPERHGIAGTASGCTIYQIPETVLEMNAEYAVSYAATASSTRYVTRYTSFPAGARTITDWDGNCWEGTRSDGTGVFSLSTTTLPRIGYRLCQIDASAHLPRTRTVKGR